MDMKEAIKKQNDVALILSRHLFTNVAKNVNSVFSPASINAAITMVASGPGGDSLSRVIVSFLGASSVDELNAVFRVLASLVFVDCSHIGCPMIKTANGVWIDKSQLPVDPNVVDLFRNLFKAVFAPVDFRSKGEEVRKEVNAWALNHTNGLIKDLLPPGSVTHETDWIYGNALYFKGAWESKFNKSMTKDKEFYLLNGNSAYVPFMSSYEDQYITAYDGFKVLRLPFRRSDIHREFSMYFYLPDEKYGLDNLVKTMESTPGFVDSHIPKFKDKVGEFRIPKFKISFGFYSSQAFSELELNVALYHKACVEIDEEGSEAAAATAVIGFGGAFVPKRMDFVADYPFLFLIREDKIGTVLFVGQIFDPSESS